MPETVEITVVDLLLDSGNPRLGTEQPDQQRTLLELIKDHEEHVLNLAADIVEHGLDPTAPIAVVATADRRKRYKVIEGNRRVLAVKALETPSLVSARLTERQSRRLAELSRRYAQAPLDYLTCVLFDSEDEADHWIRLRHTGQNDGRGLVGWGSVEQDRYNARRGHGGRKPAGQVLDFVEKHGALSAEARESSRGVLTNIDRLLSTPEARERLGVDVIRGKVVALYPLDEIVKSLTRVVEDAKTGAVTVPNLYHVGDRLQYVNALPRSVLPKKPTRLASPLVLEDLTKGSAQPQPAPRARATRARPKPRTTVVPQQSRLNVSPPRINAVYNELSALTAEQYPNACSVLLRVFIELTVDHYIDSKKLMTDAEARKKPLAAKLKAVAADLEGAGLIPANLTKAIGQIADGQRTVLAPGIPTFHMYVHNSYVFPKASDLYVAWDELGPFLEVVWP